jgi:hypothetical protein
MSRRLGIAACTATITLALLGCEERYPPMPEKWADPPKATYQPTTELPPGTDEGSGADGSLLASSVKRTYRDDAEMATWMLPFQAKTMVVELLIAAAKDDPTQMAKLLSDNARWGIPDRREVRARAIISDSDPLGVEFLAAFRKAASRFGAKASFSCTPMQPGWQNLASTGAEPVWCFYNSKDNFDMIGFRLIVEHGQVKTDYVGFFPERQNVAFHMPNVGDPPPATPYVKRPPELKLPELMPDGSSPVLEKPRRSAEPKPAEAADAADAADAAIPVEAKPG